MVNMKMQLLTALIVFMVSMHHACAEQYTSSVACTNTQLEVKLSSASSLWTANKYLNVTTTSNSSCSFLLNTTGGSPAINLPYNAGCVTFEELYGFGEQRIAYYTNINFFAIGYQDATQINKTSGNYTFNAYCMVPATAHISSGKNVNGTGGNGGGGGQNYNSSNAIWMNMTDQQNNANNAVYLGDNLRVHLVLQNSSKNIYNSLVPIYCFFSNAKQNSVARLPFINNYCPDYEMISAFQYIQKIYSPDLTHYFIDFKGFLFGEAKFGTLAVTCDVLLCINQTVCSQAKNSCSNNPWRSSVVDSETSSGFRSEISPNFLKVGAQNKDVLYARQSLEWQIFPALPSSSTASPPNNGPASEPELVCMSKQLLYFMYVALAILGLLFFVLLITVVCLLCGVGAGWRNRSEEHHSHCSVQGSGPGVTRAEGERPAKQYLTPEMLERWNSKGIEGESDSISSSFYANSNGRLVR